MNDRGATKSLLEILRVWDRLEVGPVRLQPNKLTAPYCVHHQGKRHELELAYRFEENLFDPGEAESENLAAMLAAQVALNYGLFCQQLIFHGPYDALDRRFLEEMATNTAREIYVKKFLESNPFLTGFATDLPVVRQKNYLQATLVFADPEPPVPRAKAPAKRWPSSPDRYVVLSSGGKDSLLSFGLLRELGHEVHPVFINESGRHWFTALNAYRHFREAIPHTARVWTDSDRLFASLLRHLPFVRQDFASVRADEYPIRLWTVAVFLFGALPLLRKRGVGQLVIGDEFDTTARTTFKGITHYDGLFDQSRYFDNYLTRYFHRKGWGVSQFSLLRPLSELLILKILGTRYPDLQRHQVSCHATHKEADRIRPCGRCEKCRRIVGMLKALDLDPMNCGYTPAQIERCLSDLVTNGVHQESEGAEHLAYLLQGKGMLSAGKLGEVEARRHPEIMNLRVDKERSPLIAIPTDLRRPLIQLFREHADGVVKRSGRAWIDFDPLQDPEFAKPYQYESVKGRTDAEDAGTARSPSQNDNFLLGELTWPLAERRFKEVDIALLPVGAIEQHGPHLPLDTDAFDAEYLASQVAANCSSPKPLVLPLISYGVSYHHNQFSGTISVGPDTLSKLVYEIGMGVARNGITKLIIVNGHGGNGPALHFAAQMINRDSHIFTCVETGETSDHDINQMTETDNDVHAGEIETSTTLAIRPQLVDLDQATSYVPEFSSRYLNFTSKRSVGWHAHTHKISPSGVLGDPLKASGAKGQQMWDVMIARLVEFVEDLKGMDLEEIYQRRY